MRKFVLWRNEDVSGVSGTGEVAEGVVFRDGTAVMHWNTELSSVTFFKSVEDIIAIHGHEGRTEIRWPEGE